MPGKRSLLLQKGQDQPHKWNALSIMETHHSVLTFLILPWASSWSQSVTCCLISDLENSEHIDKPLQTEGGGVRDSWDSNGDHQGCVHIMAPNGAGSVRMLPMFQEPDAEEAPQSQPRWSLGEKADELRKMPALGQILSVLCSLTQEVNETRGVLMALESYSAV